VLLELVDLLPQPTLIVGSVRRVLAISVSPPVGHTIGTDVKPDTARHVWRRRDFVAARDSGAVDARM
jgi:hypothetical protein